MEPDGREAIIPHQIPRENFQGFKHVSIVGRTHPQNPCGTEDRPHAHHACTMVAYPLGAHRAARKIDTIIAAVSKAATSIDYHLFLHILRVEE